MKVANDTEVSNQELGELIAKLQDKDDACELSDLVSAEDNVPVCADDKWDEEFMSELGPANKLTCPDDDSDEDSNNKNANEMEEPPPHLASEELRPGSGPERENFTIF